jgi:hypothetical protein
MSLSYLPKSTQRLSARTASRSRASGSPPDTNFYTPLDDTSYMKAAPSFRFPSGLYKLYKPN